MSGDEQNEFERRRLGREWSEAEDEEWSDEPPVLPSPLGTTAFDLGALRRAELLPDLDLDRAEPANAWALEPAPDGAILGIGDPAAAPEVDRAARPESPGEPLAALVY